MSSSDSDMSPIAGPVQTRGGFVIEDMGDRNFRCVFREDEEEEVRSGPPNVALEQPQDPFDTPKQPGSLTPVDELVEQDTRPWNERSKEEVLKMLKESMGMVLAEKQRTVSAVVKEASKPQRPVLRTSSVPAPQRTITREITRNRSAFAAVRVPEKNKLVDISLDDKELMEDLRFASGNLEVSVGKRVLKGVAKQVRKVEAETSEIGGVGATSIKRRIAVLDVGSLGSVSPQSTPALTPGSGTLAMPLVPWDEVKKIEEIGRGQFATVWLCQWRSVPVAMKEWHGFSNEDSLSNAVKEAETLAALRHPCVLSFYGMVTDCPSPAHIMEWMVHGSLKDKLTIMRKSGFDSPQLKASIALQAARGMDFLHSRQIIHFDLKCANLLCDLSQIDSPVVKIGDVGLSKAKLQSFVSGNMRGTLPWMAPELFPSAGDFGGSVLDRVDEMVDVYSFGVVLWEIWTLGADPYPDLDSTMLLFGLMERTLKLEKPAGCDEDWAGLIEHCIEMDAGKRPSFDQIATTLELMVKKFRKASGLPPMSPFVDITSLSLTASLASPQGNIGSTEGRFVSAESQDYLSATGSYEEEALV